MRRVEQRGEVATCRHIKSTKTSSQQKEEGQFSGYKPTHVLSPPLDLSAFVFVPPPYSAATASAAGQESVPYDQNLIFPSQEM